MSLWLVLATLPTLLSVCTVLYHWLRGNLPFYIARVHARYGTQVRLSPNRLSFIEPEAWQDIHGHDERHRKMRKIFAPGISDRALKAQEDLIRAHLDKLVGVLSREAKTGRRIDIVRFYNCTTFDIIGYIAHFFLSKNLKKALAKNVAYTADRVRKRMDRGTVTNRADFWTLVLSEHESGSVSLEQMKSNAYLFIRSMITKEDDLTIEIIQRLKYLDACFAESMRIYPSTSVGPPRVVVSAGTICGNVIPVGTRVSIGILSAYRSPENFKNPLEFVPERWLGNAPGYSGYENDHSGYENDRRQVFEPFSTGPRNCIGKSLAMHEMRLIACKMLWHFDIILCDESHGAWFKQKCFWALWSKPPLWIKVKPVNRIDGEGGEMH
ncbi:cytochrome P450 [Setomelanomma holmii]|uniref:Cytochrome P450 n=1 Tax=Setomelanomma holmii TaxID=210430 RepID=A0A9P4GWM8_9PLEO|nr:cytochrome P450 [Setomelanomma holmii]